MMISTDAGFYLDLVAKAAKAKQLGKDYGRASETIHRLRGDLALLRAKDTTLLTEMYLSQRRENDALRGELESQRQVLIRERMKAFNRV